MNAQVAEVTQDQVRTTGTSLPEIADPRELAPKDARALSRIFLVRLAELEEGTHEFQYVRNTLVEMNLSLVNFAASRFRSRGQSAGQMEDILQVGTIGLIKAIDRFDLSRENEFTTFAVPYIVGEIKRFFRDTTWAVRVPRRLQELRIALGKAKEQLFRELDRDPTVAELAEFLELDEDQIIEGLVAANGYAAESLDMPSDPDDPTSSRAADFLGEEDPSLDLFENLHTLGPLLAELEERDRRILHLRFVEEMTQSQIGAELGISQMHTSRLISRAVRRLREGLLAGQ